MIASLAATLEAKVQDVRDLIDATVPTPPALRDTAGVRQSLNAQKADITAALAQAQLLVESLTDLQTIARKPFKKR